MHTDQTLTHCKLYILLASYPGSPAFIQLERNKEGNKEQKDA